MPTATSTVTQQHHIMLKSDFGLSSSLSTSSEDSSALPQSSTSATLKSLYTRAARAFVLRDVSTTSSLLHSAFAILKPPKTNFDTLSDDRRKWDILRITFESTVYTSPPTSKESLPESLLSLLSEPPQALMSSIYNRSLALFTPDNGITYKPSLNAAFLPSQVLSTLVYCSLKVNAPDVGRGIIEDWLSRREPRDFLDGKEDGEDGYEKVLELYCLHVLPKLEQWEYAKEFLEYESELPSQRRQHLRTSLASLLNQKSASQSRFVPSSSSSSSIVPLAPSSISPRSYSPAPSSSSSSSVSTTSTHTVVPATPRYRASGLSTITSRKSVSSSSTSDSSKETATPKAPHTTLTNGNGHARHITNGFHSATRSRPSSRSRTHSSTSSVYSNLPKSKFAQEVASTRSTPPTTLALIKASLGPYLTNTRLTTFVLLFVIIPLCSFLLRLRRRRQMIALGPLASSSAALTVGGAAMAAASNADLVRRRLNASTGETGLVTRAWSGVVRVVGDTVRMAGSGLV
ncbi:hypothetical protein CPB83DRAFT_804910 [Crepidotus variabilis]|uniref:Uncharacterized protein n=1 Tax=Crepidotus variabilis TaxID=179855 RepID=A0A9P6JU72_9AGAR|nr:hypothetical protein CPB83DRAFT_804910 [Crepidotus variabilis]